MRYLILTLLTLSFAFAGDAKPLPTEAQKAVDAMEAQISKARQECLVKLNKVIMDITKTGNLEAALVVKAKETEIQEAMPHVDLFGDQTGVVGKWLCNGSVREYKENGALTAGDNVERGKWNINGSKLIVVWNSGVTETFTLPIKNNILSGSNNKGTAFTITKVVAK